MSLANSTGPCKDLRKRWRGKKIGRVWFSSSSRSLAELWTPTEAAVTTVTLETISLSVARWKEVGSSTGIRNPWLPRLGTGTASSRVSLGECCSAHRNMDGCQWRTAHNDIPKFASIRGGAHHSSQRAFPEVGLLTGSVCIKLFVHGGPLCALVGEASGFTNQESKLCFFQATRETKTLHIITLWHDPAETFSTNWCVFLMVRCSPRREAD